MHPHKPPHIGRASELSGTDRIIYRSLEILPGFLSWVTVIGAILFSYLTPAFMAFFIIAFDTYWFLKTIYLSIHLRQNWKRMKHNLSLDWREKLSGMKYDHILHVILLPFYNESYEVVKKTVEALARSEYDKKKFAIILASEAKAGQAASEVARKIEKEFAGVFGHMITTAHPAGVPGEMPGKGSNIAYAIEETRKRLIDPEKIPYENVLVSAFDIDTVVYPQYFLCLTWHFLRAPRPHRASFQPVPLYNNNIWDAPAFSRVVASSGTFWQMIQQERPEKLATFSSHSVTFKSLYEAGYWQKNMVSEDSRIYWNMFLAYDGDYEVIPISYPVSMDANLAPTFWQTIKNVYKQQRRWAWGVENVPYILFGFLKNQRIPLWKKLRVAFVQLEGFWSLATNPLLIFLLGWLPVVVGGPVFNATILSYNLPVFTRNIMILAMSGLIISAIISLSFLPDRPQGKRRHHIFFMILQWVLIPVTITIFGAIPGLDAQTRLMLGKYMGFWVTPKHRK